MLLKKKITSVSGDGGFIASIQDHSIVGKLNLYRKDTMVYACLIYPQGS